jgi:DNA primase
MSAIDEVKQKIDIAEVIGQYATLKKAGRNLTALCPFHSEKHPSFFVYPEQQSWHCFGACNTGGDVFAFIMKKEGLDFGEALRTLAQRVGVTLPSRAATEERKEEKEEFFKVNEAAALYFHNLLVNATAAAKAKSYVEKRGFTLKTIGDFQLGYSPDSWDSLKIYLHEKGHSEETMLTAGLLIKGEDGRTYDRFRGKLMIPIRDIKGRVTGFGARVLDDSLPKYVNSPQTPTFDKSSTLYGIDRAAAGIRKQDSSIIMEGYMDVIMAHQCGITNAVASMGTAITETQVNILKKLSRNLILSLDADAAGEEAMLRTVVYENILNTEIRVIILPEDKDPDDVIREDISHWQNLVNEAMPLIDFLFEKTTAKLDLNTARDKSGAVDKLLPIVAAINDPIRQAHYLQKLAGLVKVDMSTIKASLSRIKPPTARRTPHREGLKPITPEKTQHPLTSSSREEYLLALLLQYNELKIELEDLSPDYFESTENREIYNIWRETGDVILLKERLDPAIQEHLDAIINKSLPGARNNIEKRCIDCVSEMEKRYYRNFEARRAEILAMEVESGGAGADIARLQEEGMEPSTKLRELDARKSRKRNPAYKERVRR